jgi:hypothetical protein
VTGEGIVGFESYARLPPMILCVAALSLARHSLSTVI